MFQIKYQKEFIDIEPGQSPEIERSSPMFLLESLLQEKTTPFNIPFTEKNARIFGYYFFELTTRTKLKIDVELYTNASFFCNAKLIIEGAGMNGFLQSQSSLTGYILFGISHFFNDIKDKSLRSLEYGGERSFPFTTTDPTDSSGGIWQHAQETYDFLYDYVFVPYSNLAFDGETDIEMPTNYHWGNKYDGSEIVPNQPLFAFTKLSYILASICSEHGWTLDPTYLNDSTWEKLLVYSNFPIRTMNFTIVSGDPIGSTRDPVTFTIGETLPDVTCSFFFIEICKRYLWAPIPDVRTRTVRLVALKETPNRDLKDWTKYAQAGYGSEFTIEERTFAFVNNYSDDDAYPSTPDLSKWPFGAGYVPSAELLPDAAYLNDNLLYYAQLENKYYTTVYDADLETVMWVEHSDNIYDFGGKNATDTFETAATTLPIIMAQFDNGHYGLVPLVDHAKGTPWGIRTVLYHGMVPQIGEDGAPLGVTYPYASSTNQTPGQSFTYPWANVYSYTDGLTQYGISKYWAREWMSLIKNPEQITKKIYLPLHELVNFKWDDRIMIHNREFLIKSMLHGLDFNGDSITYITAKLQPLTYVPQEVELEDPDPEEELIYFTDHTVTDADRWHVVMMQHVFGVPGATLTIEIISIAESTPDWMLKINDVERFVGNTFTVTLDGSGNGSFKVELVAIPTPADGEAVSAQGQITATDMGTISTPDIATWSKFVG